MHKLLLAFVLLSVMPFLHAADGPRKLLSAWSTDCANMEKSRWFALEQHGDDKYMFVFCAGFKCIPYPGFRKPFNVYADSRVKWRSESRMAVSNDDDEAGWDGYLEFKRCREY